MRSAFSPFFSSSYRVVYKESNTGVVPIELSDPNAKVQVEVDGQSIVILAVREPWEFAVGEHELVVSGDGYQPDRRRFTGAQD